MEARWRFFSPARPVRLCRKNASPCVGLPVRWREMAWCAGQVAAIAARASDLISRCRQPAGSGRRPPASPRRSRNGRRPPDAARSGSCAPSSFRTRRTAAAHPRPAARTSGGSHARAPRGGRGSRPRRSGPALDDLRAHNGDATSEALPSGDGYGSPRSSGKRFQTPFLLDSSTPSTVSSAKKGEKRSSVVFTCVLE